MIAALVLAGGSSRRMGAEKALLPFPELPLVVAQWVGLRRALLDPLRIVVGPGAERVIAGSALSRETFVSNARRSATQFSSLARGLAALLADDTWPAAVIQPVDALPPHPAIVAALAQRFAEGDLDAVIPAHRGRGGHPVLLSRGLCREITRLDARRARLDALLHDLEARGACARLEVYTGDIHVNLNDPVSYRRALRRLGQTSSSSSEARRRSSRSRSKRSASVRS